MKLNALHMLTLAAFVAASACGGESSSSKSDEGKAQSASQSTAHDTSAVAEEAPPAAVESDAAVIPVEAVEPPEEVTGDAARGKRVFVKCFACHGIAEGQNKIGPSLYNVVGAEAGHVDSFNYSPAIAESDLVWTPDVLDAYLENPAKYLPGNKMLFPGLPSAQDRADVIAYLEANGAQ